MAPLWALVVYHGNIPNSKESAKLHSCFMLHCVMSSSDSVIMTDYVDMANVMEMEQHQDLQVCFADKYFVPSF